MDELKVRSTSRVSAQVSDRVLRETGVTRLVFRPLLVNNAKAPAAAVKGTFVFQRKSPKATWKDVAAKPLSSLHKDEGYQLTLDSAETLSLYNHLADLYKLYQSEGIPLGETSYVRASGAMAALAELSDADLTVFLDANETLGTELITRLLRWAASAHDAPRLVSVLELLGPEALGDLDTAVSLRAIAEALSLWNENRENGSEEFWQKLLSERSFLLEQLFAWPCTIITEKAYVGGKTVQNIGGNLADFLLENDLTSSAALVEIKTPISPLTGKDYRAGIPNITGGLAGSVVQVLTYKASLIESYRTLRAQADTWEIHDPPCVVIIGDTRSLAGQEQRRTFELFRRQLVGVKVVTFDELFGRLEKLVEVLAARSVDPPVEEDPWEAPF
jgi:hypothetical protein